MNKDDTSQGLQTGIITIYTGLHNRSLDSDYSTG
jgi:hypothetical protein